VPIEDLQIEVSSDHNHEDVCFEDAAFALGVVALTYQRIFAKVHFIIKPRAISV
jgi:hypothetical protein